MDAGPRGRSRGGLSTRASSQGQNLPAPASTSTGNAPEAVPESLGNLKGSRLLVRSDGTT